MLILRRKQEETVVIDNGRIVLKVTEIGQGFVRLGFSADKDVPIHRGEIQALIEATPRPSGP